MTTPADNTPVSIIEDAYFDAGLIQEGQTPNPEQFVRGMRILTDLINFEQTQGLKLWLNVDTSIPLVAGTSTYTLGPTGSLVMTRPLRAIEGYWLSSDNIRTPLVCLSWDDYMKLSQITQTGALNSYFVNKQQLTLDVFFYLCPDTTAATGTGHVLLQTQVASFTAVTDTMNFPIEWRMFLRWGLADEICTGQPTEIVQRCQQRASFYRDALENWDVEDSSTRFSPDTQQQSYNPGSFR